MQDNQCLGGQWRSACPTLTQCGREERRKTEALPHNLEEEKGVSEPHCLHVFASSCAPLQLLITWEDVDVNYSEGVRVYVDDDVHAEQGHAELHSELSDQGSHGLGAGRRQVGHLFIQLEVKRRKSLTEMIRVHLLYFSASVSNVADKLAPALNVKDR